MKKNTLIFCLMLAGLSVSLTGHAGDNIEFQLSALGEYDSSVGLSELDSHTREGDSALLLKGGLKGQWQSSQNLSFTSLYKFTHRNYRIQNAYDQNLHHLALQPQLKFGNWKAGWRHDSVFASLAGEDFMNYKLNAFSLEGSLTSGWYLRLARNLADKELEDYAERNADITGWSGDLFWFSGSGRHILALSTKTSNEDARADQHDYRSRQWKLSYTRKFSINSYASQFKISHGQQTRDYSFVYPEANSQFIAEAPFTRSDSKISTEIRLESQISEHFHFVTSLELVNNNSNFTSVDYQEEITSLGLQLQI